MTPSMNRILRDTATARVPSPAANPFAKPAKPITAAEAIRALPDKDFYTMIVAEVDRRGLGYERFGDGISRHGHEAYRRMMNKGWG